MNKEKLATIIVIALLVVNLIGMAVLGVFSGYKIGFSNGQKHHVWDNYEVAIDIANAQVILFTENETVIYDVVPENIFYEDDFEQEDMCRG